MKKVKKEKKHILTASFPYGIGEKRGGRGRGDGEVLARGRGGGVISTHQRSLEPRHY